MLAIRCFVIGLCCSAAIAEESIKMPNRLIELVKPGQAARIVNIQNSGKYNVRIYSKRKKLEILAKQQRLLREHQAQLKAQKEGNVRAISFVPTESVLDRVHCVGKDFVAFSRKPTELFVIPLGSIGQLTFEQTEKDIEEFGDDFNAFSGAAED